MIDTCLIRLFGPDATGCSWRVVGSGASRDAAHHGSLAEAAAAAEGCRVVALLPGTDVLLTEARVPARGRSKALAAIPWALEDRLIADVESLHFALGPVDADGNWPVAVIARSRLDAYLAQLQAHGIDPRSVAPEPVALPQPSASGWCALEEGDRVTVRTGARSGFACEPDLLPGVAAAAEAPERLERYRVRGAAGPDWPEALEPALTAAGEPVEVEDGIAAFEPGSVGIDLLQGPYSRRERATRYLRQWRVPASLAAVLLVLALAGTGLQYAALGEREAALREQIESIFRTTFPQVQRVVNPRAQMQTRLDSLRSGGSESGFTEILARAGGALANAGDIRLTALTWRNGQLELEVQAEELPALDGLRQALSEAGLAAELQQAGREGERVSGVLEVTEANG